MLLSSIATSLVFWIVLPLEYAVGLNGLRLSPAGLVPQRDRRDRIVIDYTWSGINEATRRLSPDSMQFGYALKRILQCMYDADPRHGPIYMMKVDIADGFYLVGLAPEDVPSLGVCLPPVLDGKNFSHIPPRSSNGMGGIPATVLCCDGNHGGSCQHCRIDLTRYRNRPYLVLTARYQGT